MTLIHEHVTLRGLEMDGSAEDVERRRPRTCFMSRRARERLQ